MTFIRPFKRTEPTAPRIVSPVTSVTASRPSLDRAMSDSQALNELIDILRKPFQSSCPKCDGRGIILGSHFCEDCGGSGKVLLDLL